MFKRCQVIMLKANVLKGNGQQIVKGPKGLHAPATGAELRRLYHSGYDVYDIFIISDDIINDEDVVYHPQSNSIFCIDSTLNKNLRDYKKVIAASSFYSKSLPSPSDAFLRKFALEQGIDEILVEYIQGTMIDPPDGWKYGFPKFVPKRNIENFHILCVNLGYPEDGDSTMCRYWETEKLKVKEDNTITIRKIKESFKRKEVIKLLTSLHELHLIEPLTNRELEEFINIHLDPKL